MIIIGCLFVALAALWFVVVTGQFLAIGVGALALVVAGGCALACWPRTHP